jgi:hypothetical protein
MDYSLRGVSGIPGHLCTFRIKRIRYERLLLLACLTLKGKLHDEVGLLSVARLPLFIGEARSFASLPRDGFAFFQDGEQYRCNTQSTLYATWPFFPFLLFCGFLLMQGASKLDFGHL